MRNFQDYISEGVYDPNIFKAFFLAGGPGSGKSWVSERALSGMGLKVINSDSVFARALNKEKMSLNFANYDEKEIKMIDISILVIPIDFNIEISRSLLLIVVTKVDKILKDATVTIRNNIIPISLFSN